MELDELNELLELEELQELFPVRREHNYRERLDHFNFWNDFEFFQRFRLKKGTVQELLTLIEDNLQHPTNRNHVVSPLSQLLITLRFYASGSLYVVIGDFGGIHKTTTGKIIKRVTTAIVALRQTYINLPATPESISKTKDQFYHIAQFPRVIGAIDCTHIKIQSPGGNNAETFRNRKGFFSINVQAICNANYEITNIVARWPGSSHDSNIFNNSLVRMKFENGEMGNSVLLGDSGYPLKDYLITPFNNPLGPAETLFNDAQIKTRSIIERTFGIWKRRFPILSLGIRSRLPMAQDIILATAILQNIARKNQDPEPEDIPLEAIENVNVPNNNEQDNRHGAARRQFVDYFETLL